MKKIKKYAISLLIITILAYGFISIMDSRMNQINKKELSNSAMTSLDNSVTT